MGSDPIQRDRARSGPCIGIVVPARNEAGVIERKLRNLARIVFPPSSAPHCVVVVDDGSNDGTADVARRVLAEIRRERSEVRWLLVRAEGRGKARAVRCGIDALGAVDLVVLTDADVILRAAALVALCEAFAEDPGLALGCGAQEFVRDLAPDGSTRAADGGAPVPAAKFFDRSSAWVRARESRFDRLFSVHGQLLAWPASLELAPSPGIAADDLDLMFAVRARGGHVRLVAGARFLELKPPSLILVHAQQMRRARAWFQVLRAWSDRRPLRRGWIDRAQWRFYAAVPAAAPEALLLFVAALLAAGFSLSAWPGLAGAALLVLLAARTVLGREVIELTRVIRRARRGGAERVDPDRWEPPRWAP